MYYIIVLYGAASKKRICDAKINRKAKVGTANMSNGTIKAVVLVTRPGEGTLSKQGVSGLQGTIPLELVHIG